MATLMAREHFIMVVTPFLVAMATSGMLGTGVMEVSMGKGPFFTRAEKDVNLPREMRATKTDKKSAITQMEIDS